MRRALRLGLLLGLMWGQLTCAAPLNVLYESDVDGPNGGRLFMQNFLSMFNFLSGEFAFQSPVEINVPTGFSVAGFDATLTNVDLLYESNVDGPNGGRLFMQNFLSMFNFLSGEFAFQSPVEINVPTGFSVVGFDVTGTEVNLLYESDVDGPNGGRLFMQNFLSMFNFLSGEFAFQSPVEINVPTGFSVVGFDVTGTEVNLLYESDVDGPNGGRLFMQNFLSMFNFLSGEFAFQSPVEINVPTGFSVRGFSVEPDLTPIPEPSTVALLVAVVAGLVFSRRRKLH